MTRNNTSKNTIFAAAAAPAAAAAAAVANANTNAHDSPFFLDSAYFHHASVQKLHVRLPSIKGKHAIDGPHVQVVRLNAPHVMWAGDA